MGDVKMGQENSQLLVNMRQCRRTSVQDRHTYDLLNSTVVDNLE